MVHELQSLVEMLDAFFVEAQQLLTGLSSEQLNWRPTQSEAREEMTSSLYGLALHMALVAIRGAARAGGRVPGEYPELSQGNSGIESRGESPEHAIQLLEEACISVREVATSLSSEQLDEMRERRFGNWVGEPKSVRWMMWHILEHTALHIGHMELTRQLAIQSVR